MKYEDILSRVAENTTLKSEIDKMVEFGVLNLAHRDWEKVLQNNIMYQDFCNGDIQFSERKTKTYIQMQWIKGFESEYHILVIGSFYLNKDDDGIITLTCRECLPLEKIYNAVMKRPKENFVAPHKFNIRPCKKAFCSDCTGLEKKFQKKNIDMKNHWCVKKNRIFNGDCVKNALEINYKNDFGKSTFLGIASLRIKGRYFYGEGYSQSKLFGDVTDVILFHEEALTQTELNIEYPDSEEMKLESCSLLENGNKEEEEGGITESLDLKESPPIKPVEAVPRGIKRVMEEDNEEKYYWNIKWKGSK